MISKEILIGAADAWLVVVSALGVLLAVVVYTRVVGLRTFSKMSSFDFAVTVAIGSAMASVSLVGSSLLAGVLAIGTFLGAQYVIAQLRSRWTFSSMVDNAPVVLMAGQEFLHDNLRRARVTEDDVRAKLRKANVYNYDQVRAVILETTGDISVIHGDHPLDLDIFRDVTDHEALAGGTGQQA
ncbi:MAG: DUF421 domain-containing protein [Actinomycetota bacterium]|nr:DUF421 domain-containing protein [Actinomycetota bacterium]